MRVARMNGRDLERAICVTKHIHAVSSPSDIVGNPNTDSSVTLRRFEGRLFLLMNTIVGKLKDNDRFR